MAVEEKEKKKVVSRIKIKKKAWYRIVAPKSWGQKELGESYLTNPESALGRILKINLRDITGNVKDQNTYVKFQINKVSGTTLNTVVVGLELTSAYVKRAVRKGTNRLDDYLVAKTKGGKKVILKLLMVTLKKIQRSVQKKLKEQFKEILKEEISRSDFDTFVMDLVNNKTYALIRKRLAKIYPVKELTVRALVLEEKGLISEEVIVNPGTVEDKSAASGEKAGEREVPAEEAAKKEAEPSSS